jgi:hypothetical protein
VSSLALLGDLEQKGVISRVGLRLTDPSMSYDRFEAICEMLNQAHVVVQWSIGDALVFGEQLYGHEAYQAFLRFNLSQDMLDKYRLVSERIPHSRRRPELNWSHHEIVSRLTPPLQDEWLEVAVVNRYSTRELIGAMQALPALPEAVERCLSCGQVIK